MDGVQYEPLRAGAMILDTVRQLRYRVLREPLGLGFTLQDDIDDEEALTFAASIGDQVVGCLLFQMVDTTTLKMRQVAVEPALQGNGIGKGLVEYAEGMAIQIGIKKIRLAARETSIPFYLKLGYKIIGEPFIEVTLPHRMMEKQLV